MDELMEYLPFLIPVVVVELILVVVALRDILTHENYKRGSRTTWIVITLVFMNFLGPILYFILGKEDE